MDIKLGPMPKHLRDLVHCWIEKAKEHPDIIDARTGGLTVWGDQWQGYHLTTDGELWRDESDDTVTRIDDGPCKVDIIVRATVVRPQLADWLPRRPAHARSCPGSDDISCEDGWLAYPGHPRTFLCDRCFGLGWVIPDDSQPGP